MIRFTTQQLEKKAENRPQGYKQEILERSVKISADIYELDDAAFTELADKYRTPHLGQKVRNFVNALAEIPTVPIMRGREEVRRCLDTCKVCPFFIEQSARCGSCGCDLMLKTLLKAWKCPKGRWT